MEKSRDRVPFALLSDLLLNFRQRATTESTVNKVGQNNHRQFHSRRQLVDRLAHRVVKVLR